MDSEEKLVVKLAMKEMSVERRFIYKEFKKTARYINRNRKNKSAVVEALAKLSYNLFGYNKKELSALIPSEYKYDKEFIINLYNRMLFKMDNSYIYGNMRNPYPGKNLYPGTFSYSKVVYLKFYRRRESINYYSDYTISDECFGRAPLLSYLPKKMSEDLDVVRAALRYSTAELKNVSDKLKKEREVVIYALREIEESILKDAPKEFFDDEDFFKEALNSAKADPSLIEYASDRIKNNKELMWYIVDGSCMGNEVVHYLFDKVKKNIDKETSIPYIDFLIYAVCKYYPYFVDLSHIIEAPLIKERLLKNGIKEINFGPILDGYVDSPLNITYIDGYKNNGNNINKKDDVANLDTNIRQSI